MRIQVDIPDDLAQALNDLAWRHNRWPKQEAEWLLWQAIGQAAQEVQPHTDEAVCAKAH